MNQGFLKIMVVQQLMQKPCSGYTLVKSINEHTGWKPSFGSIYPLLSNMQEEQLVTVKEEGRSKLYTITEKGKKTFSEQSAKRQQALQSITEQMHILASLGDEEAAILAKLISEKKLEGLPFRDIPEIPLMRAELYRLLKENKIDENRQKLRNIFAKVKEELKAL